MSKPLYELYHIPCKEIYEVKSIQNKLNITKKKQKISDEEMKIPCKNTLYYFETTNYSSSQLKLIAKHYKLKLSGKKKDIINRIKNYLMIDKYVLLLQRFTRGYFQRTYNFLHGPANLKRDLCTNNSDFYSLEPLTEIPLHQFFSFKDDDGFIYGFELSSIYHLFKENNYFDVENPYNRKMINNGVFMKICHIIGLSKLLKVKINLFIDKDVPEISVEKALELRSLELFQYINRLGNYSSYEWFLSLSKNKLIRFVRELEDIWAYRASITYQNKMLICPPTGNPFLGINMLNLIFIDDLIKLKRIVLNIMENFIYAARDETYQNLGAMYVLGALTIVNENAASALPWLYESFSVVANDSDSDSESN
jgi:hypothetical protein